MEAFFKNSAAKWFQRGKFFNLRNQCEDSLQDGTVTCCLQDSECQMKSVGKAPPDGQILQP